MAGQKSPQTVSLVKWIGEWIGLVKDLQAILPISLAGWAYWSRLPKGLQALAYFCAASCFTWALYRTGCRRKWWRNRRAGKSTEMFSVAVAPFSGNESQHLWASKIIRALENADGANLKVLRLDRPISELEGRAAARSMAFNIGADALVWGYVGATDVAADVTVYIETLREGQHYPKLSETSWSVNVPLEDVQTYRIQSRISEDILGVCMVIVGLTYYERKAYRAAVEVLTRSLETSHLGEQLLPVAWLIRGNSRFALGDVEAARSDFLRLAEYDNYQMLGHLNVGLTYHRSGDLDQALFCFENAIAASTAPQASEFLPVRQIVAPYFARGMVLLYHGHLGRAIDDYTRCAELDPTFYTAYLNRGTCFRLTEQYSQALSDFDKFLQGCPSGCEGYTGRGIVKRYLGDIPGALRDYHQAVRLGSINARYNRAILHYHQRNFVRALMDVNRVIDIKPSYLDAYVLLALIILTVGGKIRAYTRFALRECGIAIHSNPRLRWAYSVRAHAFRLAGDLEKAQADEAAYRQLCDAPPPCDASRYNLDETHAPLYR